MSTIETAPPVVPRFDASTVAIEAPGEGPGHWAGAPSAALHDGAFYLAYRLRRPVGQGRGFGLGIARSDDGERFETLTVLHQEDFGTDSFERPALVVRPDGGWRLYLSLATPGTLHWSIEALDADDPGAFSVEQRRPVLPGDAVTAFKDPVVAVRDGRWHMWACIHEIADPAEADRMYSRYGTSDDGLQWDWHGTALAGREGAWDSRGARITDVLLDEVPPVALYDGRASFAENWEERTGLAVVAPDAGQAPLARFVATGDAPAAVSPHHGGALRYVSAVRLEDGGYRLFYEASREDGAHDLRTEYVPPSR